MSPWISHFPVLAVKVSGRCKKGRIVIKPSQIINTSNPELLQLFTSTYTLFGGPSQHTIAQRILSNRRACVRVKSNRFIQLHGLWELLVFPALIAPPKSSLDASRIHPTAFGGGGKKTLFPMPQNGSFRF